MAGTSKDIVAEIKYRKRGHHSLSNENILVRPMGEKITGPNNSIRQATVFLLGSYNIQGRWDLIAWYIFIEKWFSEDIELLGVQYYFLILGLSLNSNLNDDALNLTLSRFDTKRSSFALLPGKLSSSFSLLSLLILNKPTFKIAFIPCVLHFSFFTFSLVDMLLVFRPSSIAFAATGSCLGSEMRTIPLPMGFRRLEVYEFLPNSLVA